MLSDLHVVFTPGQMDWRGLNQAAESADIVICSGFRRAFCRLLKLVPSSQPISKG